MSKLPFVKLLLKGRDLFYYSILSDHHFITGPSGPINKPPYLSYTIGVAMGFCFGLIFLIVSCRLFSRLCFFLSNQLTI